MHGSLCFKNGVLYVGRHLRTAHVRPYDVDGRALGPGFGFESCAGGRASVHGLAVDEDHRFWIADGASGMVRAFTSFGRELANVRGREPRAADRAGSLGEVIDVDVTGVELESRVWIASAERRRHAVQCFDRDGVLRASARPLGDPQAEFHGVVRLTVSGRLVYVCEPAAGRIQVFRDDEFHFVIALPASDRPSGGFRPRCAAALADGRVVVAHGDVEAGVLAVLDGGGRTLQVLARAGVDTGDVLDPVDVVVDDRADDARTRIAVLDRAGDRVQIFTLDGRCFGAFVELPEPQSRMPRRGADRS
ncbi:MAG: hypothetical protein ACKVWV_07165 [Planctomycetota bacterium]